MRNTKAFKEAVAQTLAELAHRGVTLAPATVAETIEQQITTVSERLGIQVRSAWRYFDASATADRLAQSLSSYEESSSEKGVGQAPMPPIDNPELALVLAGVPDSLRPIHVGFRPPSLITRAALLGSVTFATTSVFYRGRAVELERYDRAGHRST